MKIVCDENMPAVEALFSSYGEVCRLPGRNMSPEDLAQADILLVRSVTQVNQALISQASSLKMVGTATIGTDHIDQTLLSRQGIHFSSAPGCNAEAVVDYDLSCIFQVLHEQGRQIEDLTVGIIGVGNVGSRLAKRLNNLNVHLLLNDPPKAELNPHPDLGEYASLEKVLKESDIICCHTPLVQDGPFPSHHLINADNLSLIKPDAILLNAGRGPVIDNQALKTHLKGGGKSLTVILDVWEHEPTVDHGLAQCIKISTPHIAGYSLEGKLRGTFMLYQSFCRFFGYPQEKSLDSILPPPALSQVSLNSELLVHDVMRWVYDPYRDDRALRMTIESDSQPQEFDQLRKSYPVRREFSSLLVSGQLTEFQASKLSACGFTLDKSQEVDSGNE